jgi:murein DD-endopeptidase MepM/ murein hydrolase activator NlpD
VTRTTWTLPLCAALSLGVTSPAAAERALTPQVDCDQQTNGVVFRATNPYPYPITVRLQVASLDNMRASRELPATVTLPADSESLLLELSPISRQARWTYGRWDWRWQPGRHDATHDRSAVYQLPYPRGHAYYLVQGYDGEFSHKGERALDFDLPLGTPVHAARAGQVVRVKEDSQTGGPDEKLGPQANQVWVLHADGTIARYMHLQHQGADVELGQRVAAGDLLGRSGDTGYSRGPHLHFDVFVPDADVQDKQTLATRFETDEGPRVELTERGSPMRPFAKGEVRRVPLNALTRIRFAKGVVDGDPVQLVDRFAPGDTAHVFLDIGARRRYQVAVTFHRGQARRERAREELVTQPDWSQAWVTHDVAGLRLRGRPCVVKVFFDGELVGEASFSLER